jgi:hypothetical protein
VIELVVKVDEMPLVSVGPATSMTVHVTLGGNFFSVVVVVNSRVEALQVKLPEVAL